MLKHNFIMFLAACLFSVPMFAKKASFGTKSKTYTKKTSYEGFGKPSKVNRLPKTKNISGHSKRTSNGFTYVNPYARSK